MILRKARENLKKKSVAAAIFEGGKGKVLLIKRRDIPIWTLPGGGIEQGEDPETAVIREVEEETGYKVRVSRKVGEYYPPNKLTSYTYLYECAIVSGTPTIGLETKEIQFFSFDQLPHLTPPPYPEWILDTLSSYPYPILKKLSGVNYVLLLKTFMMNPSIVIRFLLTRFGIHFNR